MEGFDFGIMIEKAVDIISAYWLDVVGALVILVLGYLICKIIRGSARKALYRSKIDDTLVPFLSGILYYLLLIIVIIAAASRLGFNPMSAVAILGAAGLAVGLALQGTLSNFAAGVMLLIFRPFKAGDFVEAAGVAGSIVEIGIFSTLINTPDNVRIVVPNSGVYGQTIKNYSFNENRRIDLVAGISYDDDIGTAVETLKKILESDERVLKDPAYTIAVSELADSSVNLVVRPWCKASDYWPLRFDLTRRIKVELEAAGCSIPYPQSDVHMYQAEGPGAA